jgi:ABC-type branched-subunit amino acid transport system substrate-binding protein
MQIGTFQSAGLSLIDAENGVKADVAVINKSGGVDGHKIEVQYCNDGFVASTAAACARTAVQDHDVAIVGGASAESPSIIPYLQKNGIPWLGGTGAGGPIEQTSPISYPLTGGTQSDEVGMGRILTDLGDKQVAVIIADAAAAYPAYTAVAQGVTLGGGTVTARVLAPIGAPDFSSVAASAIASNPNGIAIASVPGDAPRIALALRQAGYTGPISTLSAIMSEASIQSLGTSAQGIYLLSDYIPTNFTQVPQVRKYIAGMKKDGFTSANIDPQSIGGWAAMSFFQAIVQDLGSKPVTPKSIIALLKKLPKPMNLGLVAPYDGVKSPPLVAAYPRVPTFNVYASEVESNGSQVAYNHGNSFNPLG